MIDYDRLIEESQVDVRLCEQEARAAYEKWQALVKRKQEAEVHMHSWISLRNAERKKSR